MKYPRFLATIVAGIGLLCAAPAAKAQHPCQEGVTQNSFWSAPAGYLQFDDEFGVNLFPLPIPANPEFEDYTGQIASNAHNAIHDQNGDLLFFLIDDRLYDRNGRGLARLNLGNAVTSLVKGYSEICVVPDPGDCSRYYIFSSTAGESFNEFRAPAYSVLDMNLPNPDDDPEDEPRGALIFGGFGDFNMKNLFFSVPLFNADSVQAYPGPHDVYFFAASPLNEATNSRLLLVATSEGVIYRIRIHENGLEQIWPPLDFFANTLPDFELTGIGNLGRFTLELKQIDSTKYRMATVMQGENVVTNQFFSQIVLSVDLDLDGNYIPNSAQSYNMQGSGASIPYVKGLEYSENGRYLYFTHHTNSNFPDAVQYIDLDLGQTHSLNVPNSQNYQRSQIELAADSLLYFAHAGGLASLEDSNDPSSLWSPLAVAIPGGYPISDMGFPSQTTRHAYTLPDQIDGMDYFEHFFVTKECCLLHPPHDAQYYTAWASGTWSPGNNPFSADPDCDVVLINNELRIPSGVTLTIQDMRFEFFENARVVIETGGRLNMNNTIFTSGPCGCEMWLGVEVWGNPAVAQLPFSNQGYLHMTNNSVIENAYIGAMAASRQGSNQNNLFQNNENGGVIRAYNSRFRNNQRDVLVQNYMWLNSQGGVDPNRCYFENCDFLTDGLLNNPVIMLDYHVQLNRVHNVPFRNCSWRNTASFEDFEILQRGVGLYSLFSTFRVTGQNEPFVSAHDTLAISENVHQTFYRLNGGVVTLGQPNHFFTVSNMEFQDNRYGALVLGNSYETITFNNFKVPETSDDYPGNNYGAYLMNSYLFTIEENHFFGEEQNTMIAGLVIDNSCPDDAEDSDDILLENEVYRNTFSNLGIGLLVLNDNRDQNSEVGLQARCNVFESNYYADISLGDYSEWRKNQGALNPPEAATNNLFSYGTYNCAGIYRDVFVSDLYGALQSPNNLTIDYYTFQNPDFTKPWAHSLNPDPQCAQPKLILHDVIKRHVGLRKPLSLQFQCWWRG